MKETMELSPFDLTGVDDAASQDVSSLIVANEVLVTSEGTQVNTINEYGRMQKSGKTSSAVATDSDASESHTLERVSSEISSKANPKSDSNDPDAHDDEEQNGSGTEILSRVDRVENYDFTVSAQSASPLKVHYEIPEQVEMPENQATGNSDITEDSNEYHAMRIDDSDDELNSTSAQSSATEIYRSNGVVDEGNTGMFVVKGDINGVAPDPLCLNPSESAQLDLLQDQSSVHATESIEIDTLHAENVVGSNSMPTPEENDVATKPAAVTPPTPVEVIDLLDSDDESDDTTELVQHAAKRKRVETTPLSSREVSSVQPQSVARMPPPAASAPQHHQAVSHPQLDLFRLPQYLEPIPGFIPSWKQLMCRNHKSAPKRLRAFQLSLLNVSEFTIMGMRVGDECSGYMTSLAGLRSHIKHISKGHGNAIYERDPEGGEGKWHIPLGAYHAFYGFLRSDPMCKVDGIPEEQLKIASLGKARLEKEYPSARKLIRLGVPAHLARTLAPFQRGGVDFAIDKHGRALIADEMGLGKTIQGIASMAVYHEEWPVLILCPSSARYHWENEFRHWLGKNSNINKSTGLDEFDNVSEDESDDEEQRNEITRPAMEPLDDCQINVLTAGRDAIFPTESTRVVICSYGLAPALVTSDKITPGIFKCAIVDESHMLKNKGTQRTKALMPVLRATNRCILLSGTPAFAKPMELWPQLLILGTEQDGWWQDEDDFMSKYVRSSKRRAELHTMLMGTVMIRRMKNDILKTLPPKVREQGIVDVMDSITRKQMQEYMAVLRLGKGKLSEIAKEHTDVEEKKQTEPEGDSSLSHHQVSAGAPAMGQAQSEFAAAQLATATEQLRQDIEHRRAQGQDRIRHALDSTPHQLDPRTAQSFVQQLESRLEHELHVYYQEQMQQIQTLIYSGVSTLPPSTSGLHLGEPSPNDQKKAILNQMYSLTGKAKIPFIVDMLRRWLDDPTRGKLCLFAHHISVLDAISKGASLSNGPDSSTKYIRIDGSTSPQARQEQINAFQDDPLIRVAILGITAAGVAVTLTAASTVWFAELFWTPAIMVQAEDRCHRIGQQARVNCLYFVAKGTLDELLWKLLQKKFEDLGEFVEGKEKMKIVVSKTYRSTRELLKSLEPMNLAEEGDAFFDDNAESNTDAIEEISSDIEHEIEELGLSEQKELDASMGNDDSDPEESDAKPAAKPTGEVESEVICLSDDDDDEVQEVTPSSSQAMEQPLSDSQEATVVEPGGKSTTIDFQKSFPRLRLYKLLFVGESFGVNFSLIKDRMVVTGISKERTQQFGFDAKPHFGDVLAGINGLIVPLLPAMDGVAAHMLREIQKGTVELIFAEDADIKNLAQKLITAQMQLHDNRRRTQLQTLHAAAPQSPITIEADGAGSAKPSAWTPNSSERTSSQVDHHGKPNSSAVIELINED